MLLTVSERTLKKISILQVKRLLKKSNTIILQQEKGWQSDILEVKSTLGIA